MLGLWLCRDAFRQPAWRDWVRVFDRERLRLMAVVNSDIMLRSLMLQGIFVSFLFLGSKFDDVTLASNQVLMQFLSITAYALDGFAFAAEALVGQAMGAGNRCQLRRGAIMTSQWGLVMVVLLAGVFALFGGSIIDLLAKVPEVQVTARIYLIYMVLAPLLGLASWMLDGIFIGATRSRDMRNMMAISLVGYIVAVMILLPLLGNHGLWLALLISFVIRGVTLGLRYPALEAAAGR
jgi:MATE family multidrug resistance protein